MLTHLFCCCALISRPNRKHHHSLLLQFHQFCMTPSYTLKQVQVLYVDHVQYSLRVYNVKHSFKVEPHLFLDDLSSSFGQHSSIQFHLGGGQFVH